MTADTLPPPKDGISPELARLATAAGEQRQARLIGPDGGVTDLPAEVYEALRDVVRAMSDGHAVTIAVSDSLLTTQQAADLLGVSRPTVVKLIDTGQLPSSRPGRHRRLRLQDVLAYRDRRRENRVRGLSEMVRISDDMGLYDDESEMPIRR